MIRACPIGQALLLYYYAIVLFYAVPSNPLIGPAFGCEGIYLL